MAAHADTTSADVLGRASPGASGGNCRSWAEGDKIHAGLAAALAEPASVAKTSVLVVWEFSLDEQ